MTRRSSAIARRRQQEQRQQDRQQQDEYMSRRGILQRQDKHAVPEVIARYPREWLRFLKDRLKRNKAIAAEAQFIPEASTAEPRNPGTAESSNPGKAATKYIPVASKVKSIPVAVSNIGGSTKHHRRTKHRRSTKHRRRTKHRRG